MNKAYLERQLKVVQSQISLLRQTFPYQTMGVDNPNLILPQPNVDLKELLAEEQSIIKKLESFKTM